jgi:hypothetical protein
MLRFLSWLGLLLHVCWALPAAAEIERYAVIVGNNRGHEHEAALRYATADARRVYEVLRDIGGFSPMNMVLLEESGAEELRRTLISVNARVRSALAQPGRQVVLVVYYSGHANAEALHMGRSQLPVSELSELVRGSAANFRLMVLDACRSGVVTQTKGGRVIEPFALPEEVSLPGEGVALLAASAAHEDSQESDALRASFFTHALVSGLLGAADFDRDGKIVLEEVYRYAYQATLRATSRSVHGTQHPTFSYDLHGQGQLVLTTPALRTGERGILALPAAGSYLVLRESSAGQVVAEVASGDGVRTLNLASGSYFLRGRVADHLLEGAVQVVPLATTQVSSAQLTRVEYAKLARKGDAERPHAHGLEAGARLRSTLPNAERPCYGAYAAYRFDTRRAALSAYASFCRSGFDNPLIEAHADEYAAGLRASHVWDLGAHLAFELGAGLAFSLFSQRFDTAGAAPALHSGAGEAEAFAALPVELAAGVYVSLELAAQLYVLPLQDTFDGDSAWQAALAGRAGLGVGKRF